MAAGRVIEDSDDDQDGDYEHLSSPEQIPVNEKQFAVTKVSEGSMPQTSSTDPVLFQAIYEQHLGVTPLRSRELRDSFTSHAFENPVMDQSMSSSSTSSIRKLKRSRTINISSLTSISELTASNRESKRTKSMKDVEDLTRATTPRKTKSDNDPWEFPSSSISGGSKYDGTKIRSRNAETSTPLKTYGRLRRSHTSAHSATAQKASSPTFGFAEGESRKSERTKRPAVSATDDDLQPSLPRAKRQKRVVSESPDLLGESSITKDASAISNHMVSRVEGAETDQIPSEELLLPSTSSLVGRVNGNNTKISSSKAGEDSLMANRLSTMTSSIAVIPNALTEEQKLEYEAVSVASTAQIQGSSLPDLLHLVGTNLKYPDESSTIPIETPLPKLSSSIAQSPARVMLLSSSPPISSPYRTIKRAKSEVGLKGPPSVAMSRSSGKVTKCKGRSKTIAYGETPPLREASFDELSLSQLGSVEVAAPSKRSIETGETTTPEPIQEKGVTLNDRFSSDDLGLPKEPHKPRLSLRRSKSMYMQPSQDAVDLAISKAKNTRKNSSKMAKTSEATGIKDSTMDVSIPGDDSASVATMSKEGNAQKQVQQDETSNGHENMEDVVEVIPAEVEHLPTMPTVPAQQPKKRGRPKKNLDVIADKQKDIRDTSNPELFQAVRNALSTEQSILREADSNIQMNQPPTSTPVPGKAAQVDEVTPPKATATETNEKQIVPTPTKEVKKGPDQHSPLASGKVPYRVGLSKRTKIAPLLKIIKK